MSSVKMATMAALMGVMLALGASSNADAASYSTAKAQQLAWQAVQPAIQMGLTAVPAMNGTRYYLFNPDGTPAIHPLQARWATGENTLFNVVKVIPNYRKRAYQITGRWTVKEQNNRFVSIGLKLVKF
jgi:hypothetical protein